MTISLDNDNIESIMIINGYNENKQYVGYALNATLKGGDHINAFQEAYLTEEFKEAIKSRYKTTEVERDTFDSGISDQD